MSNADLTALLAEAREFNERHEITVLLLYVGANFYQILEGDQAQVQSLFARIETDERQEDVTLLFQGMVSERSFPQWWMGFAELAEASPENQNVCQTVRTLSDLDKLPGYGDRLFGVMRTMFGSNR